MLGKMPERMLGAALLNPDTFEDVEHDRGAMIQAALVVIIVSIAAVVGGILAGDGDILRGLGFGVVRGIVSWAVWAGVAMLVGTTILKTAETHADWGQVARGTGFAQTPGVLSILVFIPYAGPVIAFAAFIWSIVAMIISLRQTLDYNSTWRAFFVAVISLIPVIIINGVIFWLLGLADTGADAEAETTARMLPAILDILSI